MEIISNKNEIIFRKDFEGKPRYSLGLHKKDAKNNFLNGYIKVNFKKGTDLADKTRIKIKNAWLDFYIDNGKTVPTIFINEFEIVEDKEYQKPKEDAYQYMKTKVESDIGEQIQIEDNDLPF